MSDKKVKLLSDYGIFLEKSLSMIGFSMSRSNILELTGDEVDINYNQFNPSLRLINISRLDDILRFPSLEPNVDIIYAQFPIKEISYTLDNLASIPVITHASSVLGVYGFDKYENLKKHNLEYIKIFRELLDYYDVDFDVFDEEKDDSYFSLTIGNSKKKTR